VLSGEAAITQLLPLPVGRIETPTIAAHSRLVLLAALGTHPHHTTPQVSRISRPRRTA
jgi:hypothetical protein